MKSVKKAAKDLAFHALQLGKNPSAENKVLRDRALQALRAAIDSEAEYADARVERANAAAEARALKSFRAGLSLMLWLCLTRGAPSKTAIALTQKVQDDIDRGEYDYLNVDTDTTGALLDAITKRIQERIPFLAGDIVA